MSLGSFRALQFLLPALKLLAEIKTKFFKGFLPPRYLIRAFKQCHLK